ncbi:DUF3397 family protein [Latilactobacillus sakei]
MPFTATLFFILLPLICLAIGYGLNLVLQRFFKKQLHFVDWLPVPFLISAIALSQPFFNKVRLVFLLGHLRMGHHLESNAVLLRPCALSPQVFQKSGGAMSY